MEEIERPNCCVDRFHESVEVVKKFVEKGYSHLAISFSGGKDSTTTLIVVLEAALLLPDKIERIDVLYADTGLEIPVIHKFALEFLEFLRNFQRIKSLPVEIKIVRPKLEESFWVCLLGKGYTPPHQRFRWCTKRLKVAPAGRELKMLTNPSKTLVITGVRYGESQSRDNRLINNCSKSEECEQGVWFQNNPRLNIGYLAPIVNWSDDEVWDFLNTYAPRLGYPTEKLESEVYYGRETRFGCWMCTVVKQDKTLQKLSSLPQWSHLRPLLLFRERVLEISSNPNSREVREDGKLGRLKVSVRKELLEELLELQKKVGLDLITEDEIEMIKKLWDVNEKEE
jgi:DNA sulfur modification protein DndC